MARGLGIDPVDRPREAVAHPDRAVTERDAARAVANLNRLPDRVGRGIDTVDSVVGGVRHPDRARAVGHGRRRRADGYVRDDAVRLRVDEADRVPGSGLERLAPATPAEGEDGDRHSGCDHCHGGQENRPTPPRTRLGDLLGTQRRKVGLEPFDVELGQRLGTIDVLEPIGAQVAYRHASDIVLDQLPRCAREQHLTAVRDRSDARRSMHPEPDVPLVSDGGLSRVQAHAHTHLLALGPVVLCQSALSHYGSAESRVCAREGEEERVTLRVDLAPFARVYRFPQNAPMVGEDVAIPLPELLQQPGRSLDVREQEGDGPTWELGHLTIPTPAVRRCQVDAVEQPPREGARRPREFSNVREARLPTQHRSPLTS
jgi:hypothetical protein